MVSANHWGAEPVTASNFVELRDFEGKNESRFNIVEFLLNMCVRVFIIAGKERTAAPLGVG